MNSTPPLAALAALAALEAGQDQVQRVQRVPQAYTPERTLRQSPASGVVGPPAGLDDGGQLPHRDIHASAKFFLRIGQVTAYENRK